MKVVLFNLFTILSLTFAVDNVVLDLQYQCYEPLIASNSIDPNINSLTMDEYKAFVDDLIDKDEKYREIDATQISGELGEEFDGLVDSCPNFFNITTDTVAENCSKDEIKVTGDTDMSKAFVFTVCERTIEFLNEKVASEAPSLAPTFEGKVYSFKTAPILVEAEGKDGTQDLLKTTGKEVELAVETYFQNADFSSLQCKKIYFLGSEWIEVESKSIACSSSRKTFSSGDFEDPRCFSYIIETDVRLGIACSENDVVLLKNMVDKAYKKGELDELLCNNKTEATCSVITFVDDINRNPVVFGTAFGVVGALILLIGWKTCGNKNQKTDLSEPAIEVEFPVPQLPREDEKVQLEQQIPSV